MKKHFKKLFDVKKSKYLDDDDVEYKGIRDLEHLFEEINENDYYKPILVKISHSLWAIKNMRVKGIRIKHYQ